MRVPLLVALASTSCVAFGVLTASDEPMPGSPLHAAIVRQDEHGFDPAAVQLAVGQPLVIANAAAALHNHPYLDGGADLGDIAPGARAETAFASPGTYRVLCGIHPSISLAVTVR